MFCAQEANNDTKDYMTYITIKDSTKEVSSILNNNMMKEIRMNDYANNIIVVMTKCIFINSEGTFTIRVVRPN